MSSASSPWFSVKRQGKPQQPLPSPRGYTFLRDEWISKGNRAWTYTSGKRWDAATTNTRTVQTRSLNNCDSIDNDYTVATHLMVRHIAANWLISPDLFRRRWLILIHSYHTNHRLQIILSGFDKDENVMRAIQIHELVRGIRNRESRLSGDSKIWRIVRPILPS